MVKSSALIYLIGFCLLQFSLMSSVQFLPLESEDLETEFNSEEYSLFEEEQQFVLAENTPQEIGAAINQNAAAVLQVFFELYSKGFKARVDRTENASYKDLYWLESDFFGSITGYSDEIGHAVGVLATHIITSFQEAVANDEDVGSAVGGTVVKALGELNNQVHSIGSIIQQPIDESLSKSRYLPEDYVVIFRGAGGAIERFINSINSNAQIIGDLVATAVNKAVSQGRNPSEIIGIVVTEIFQGIADNAEVVSKILDDAVMNALSEIDGIAQTDIHKARENVQKMMKKVQDEGFRDFGINFGQFITKWINEVSTVGLNGEGAAKDTVEVINRIGNFFIIELNELKDSIKISND